MNYTREPVGVFLFLPGEVVKKWDSVLESQDFRVLEQVESLQTFRPFLLLFLLLQNWIDLLNFN